ncbi:MAG: glycoside hydrolase family 32 protein [Anaerolineae bacterium]
MTIDEQSEKIQAARELREQLLRDKHRPGYHFAMPEDIGRPGDPNGAFYANGRYHLMYLYDRRGVDAWQGRGFCWGHISSHDLVHWRHHPDAIGPGDGDGGCFSGGGFVDDDGTAYISYWRLPLSEGDAEGSGIGIARSRDRHYETWEKMEVTGLDATEFGILEQVDEAGELMVLCNADPSNIWKKDGVYYMEAGNLPVLNKLGREEGAPLHYRGDWVDLFSSKDLMHWQYIHRFYRRDTANRWTQESEDDMCPSYLPLPRSLEGGKASGKYLQLFISHNRGCQYYIGTYDTERDLFLPETHGRMSWMDKTYFAPEALIDGRGRQIMWAWLTDNLRPEIEDAIADGWCGVYALPRVLWLGEDDTLRLAPAPELEVLRYNPKRFDDITLDDDTEFELQGINGRSCEIEFCVDLRSAQRAGVQVRSSAKGEETTLLYYDAPRKVLVFDATRSGSAENALLNRSVVEEAPLAVPDGQPLRLRVFVDHSVVEVFANDRQAIARRVYPEREDSDQVRLYCQGGATTFSEIETWEMMPSNGW